MTKGKIFISYRRSDSGFASVAIKNLLLYRYLHEDQLFMDLDSIRPGEPFPAKLDNALSECNLVLAMIGTTWLQEIQHRMQTLAADEEDFVRLELATSLARNRPIIPVLLDGAQMPNPKSLPPDLQALTEKNAVSVDYRTFDSDVAKLVKGLRLYEVECAKPPSTISGPQREQREVTVLIARVHGLEGLCLEHPGDESEALLGACMQGLDNAALDQDGFVSRDAGARIAAFFGAPDAHDDDPERACLAALQMRDYLKHFAARKHLGNSVSLSLSAGIDVGVVTSGNVGPKGTFGILGSAGAMADGPRQPGRISLD
ncbi:MAG: TIR domain-containing protein [Verrucomicrobia bacterium]|nr:TIR domain-containing protein [Verrucomicrobiota bacterium]